MGDRNANTYWPFPLVFSGRIYYLQFVPVTYLYLVILSSSPTPCIYSILPIENLGYKANQ